MPPKYAEIDPQVGADALAESVGLTATIQHHQTSTGSVSRKRRQLWLTASRSGITYKEIASACGVNESVVDDAIRTARREAP